jgi:arylsulfatase A-like enzyme
MRLGRPREDENCGAWRIQVGWQEPCAGDHVGRCAHKTFYWQLGSQWAVREGDWKLLGHPKDNSKKSEITSGDHPFLVNLAVDVTELKNQAQDHPDVVEWLTKLREEYARDFAGR